MEPLNINTIKNKYITDERILFLKVNLFIPVFGVPFALYSVHLYSLGIDFSFEYLMYYFILMGCVVGLTYFYGVGILVKLFGRLLKAKTSLKSIVTCLFQSSILISFCIYTWVIRFHLYILDSNSGFDVFLNQALEIGYPFGTILFSMSVIEVIVFFIVFVLTIYKLSKVMNLSIVKTLICWLIPVMIFIYPLIYINKACMYFVNHI